MADLKNLSVEEFAAVTGSDAPAPGGGSVAALAGGLGEMCIRDRSISPESQKNVNKLE